MADPAKVANVCNGINLDELNRIRWIEKNHDGVPQLGELRDSAGTEITDEALVGRIASAAKCSAALQEMLNGMQKKPASCLQKLAAAKKDIKKALDVLDQVRDSKNFIDHVTAGYRVFDILERWVQ